MKLLIWSLLVLVSFEPAYSADLSPINSVKFEGDLEAPFVLDQRWLDAAPTLPKVTVERPITKPDGTSAKESFTGYLLRDLLKIAKPIQKDRHDWKKQVISATAFDGYVVVFSNAELVNSKIGDEVVLYFQKDGKSIDLESEGFGLISTADTRTGPRHVKVITKVVLFKPIP